MYSSFRLASVAFFGPDSGGRISLPESGIRPQLKISDSLMTSCKVESVDSTQAFLFGVKYEVRLFIAFDEYEEDFQRLEKLELFEGSKKIAEGVFSTDG